MFLLGIVLLSSSAHFLWDWVSGKYCRPVARDGTADADRDGLSSLMKLYETSQTDLQS